MGQTKSKWKNGQIAFYDGSTYETVKPIAPAILYDDFLGTTTNTDIWTSLHNGGGSIAHATSNLTLSLAGAGATEEEGVSGKDDKAWNADKGFIFECRLKLTTAPTLTAEVIMGVQNDNWGAGANRSFAADEVTIGAFFGFYSTVGAGLVAQIRTDFTDATNVLFYIDGVAVATSTTFDMSNGTNIMFQPVVVIQKVGAGGEAGVCVLDYIKMWQPTR